MMMMFNGSNNTSASEPLPAAENDTNQDYDDDDGGKDGHAKNNDAENGHFDNELDDDYVDDYIDDDDDDDDDDNNHHSLPSPEELKVDLGISSGSSTNNDEPYVHPVIGIIMMLLFSALVVGLSVGLTSDNRGGNATVYGDVASPAEQIRLRRQRIVNYIVKHGVSRAAHFELISSPQSQAIDFLVVTDRLRLDVPKDEQEGSYHSLADIGGAGGGSIGGSSSSTTTKMSSDGYKLITRYAMAVLYFSTGGPNKWISKNGFLTVDKETCEWLVLDDTYGYGGIRCDTTSSSTDSHVITGIRFVNNNLGGTLPQELGHLSTLTSITIVANSIVGTFPSSFQKLTNLQIFGFHKNLMTGTIPSWLGSGDGGRTSLSPISSGGAGGAAGNGGVGASLPTDVDEGSGSGGATPGSAGSNAGGSGGGGGGLDQLVFLDVSSNMFTGKLPPFNIINNESGIRNKLEVLAVDDNNLSGPIDGVWDHLPNLKHLNIEKNSFTGEGLPNSLAAHTPEIITLDISDNRLEGTLPKDLFQLTELEILDIHGNSFSGTLPGIASDADDDVNKLWPLWSTLKYEFVALHGNSLSGTIPTTFGANLAAGETLRHLDISQNSFTGHIPVQLKNLTLSRDTLSYLSLGDNDFSPGPIPTFLYTFSKLRELSLKSTARTGSLSPLVAVMRKLVLLDVSSNGITGEIPTELGEMPNLQFLLLHRNSFTGEVPGNDLVKLSTLQLLLLDRNDLSGSMEPLCNALPTLRLAAADCLSEIACECCELCCADENENDCHDLDFEDTVDWSTNYERDFFNFGRPSENFEVIAASNP